jgi:hypothetical protein
MATDSNSTIHTSIRIDRELRRRLEEAAKSSVRSFSGEVAYRLQRSLAQQAEEAAA